MHGDTKLRDVCVYARLKEFHKTRDAVSIFTNEPYFFFVLDLQHSIPFFSHNHFDSNRGIKEVDRERKREEETETNRNNDDNTEGTKDRCTLTGSSK